MLNASLLKMLDVVGYLNIADNFSGNMLFLHPGIASTAKFLYTAWNMVQEEER